MANKSISFRIKGMRRDISVTGASPEFAYENYNIRITARDKSTLLSVTNERGNKKIPFKIVANISNHLRKSTNGKLRRVTNGKSRALSVGLQGTIIGHNILNNYLILFIAGDIVSGTTDMILRVEKKEDVFEVTDIYSGNLNFNSEYPIESICVYETEDIQKIYWTDGVNPLRAINIVGKDYIGSDTSLDLVSDVKYEIPVVTKMEDSTGQFQSGVIQYAFSYYNKYGSESNIFYTTPLYYISNFEAGSSPEDKVNCAFKITLNNLDLRFEYLRVYSIHRTSIDATPSAKVVTDIKVSSEIIIIDNGSIGYSIDPQELLYIGGESIVAQTMCQKDGTLFLGNVKGESLVLDKKLKENIKASLVNSITFEYRSLPYPKSSGYYPYKNQLNEGSDVVKTFKAGETYRIGIQFQHKTGKYSDVVHITDIKNTLYPSITEMSTSTIMVPRIKCNLPSSIIPTQLGYVKARLVMAIPQASDRSVVCQGILCPTVYNMSDRCNNSPFSVSSWFSRPMKGSSIDSDTLEYRHNMPLPSNNVRAGEIQTTVNPKRPYVSRYDLTPTNRSVVFRYMGGSGNNNPFYFRILENSTILYEFLEMGYVTNQLSYEAAYKKAKSWGVPSSSIPSMSEWQVLTSDKTVSLSTSDISYPLVNKFIREQSDNFYVDQSILTMHSPDIEDNQNAIDGAKLKLRIVGAAHITSVLTDYTINASETKSSSSIGQVDYDFSVENTSTKTSGLINAPLWNDAYTTSGSSKNTLYAVYPWHRKGSLNEDGIPTGDVKRTADLQRKAMSNLRFSYSTRYFQTPWEAEVADSQTKTGITTVQVFNSNEVTNIRIPKPEYSDLGDLNYYGNVDKIVTYHDLVTGYPIQCVGEIYEDNIYDVIDKAYTSVDPTHNGKDPVSIKYKSTPHAVFAFNYSKGGQQRILPWLGSYNVFTAYDNNDSKNKAVPWSDLEKRLQTPVLLNYWVKTPNDLPSFPDPNLLAYIEDSQVFYISREDFSWDGRLYEAGTRFTYRGVIYLLNENRELSEATSSVIQDSAGNSPIIADTQILYIGELYRDIDSKVLYGGNSESAIQSNKWIPISNPESGGNILYGNTGDCYFQRWDCLKTYAFTNEDSNSVVDIVSFMCETRVNVDGRYDKNRGQKNNLSMSPSNFNLINKVYSQSDNFFNYEVLDDKFSLNNFSTSIVWSKEKQMASDIDSWSSINMASMLTLDGDKGDVTSLNTFNNEIFCFQRRGFSNILFNSRVQIPTSDGVPIEITNGLKVQGKRYITESIGCLNKWSIVETPKGIYFIDYDTDSLYLFNGSINSLSDELGFRQWIGENNSELKWDPKSYNNFRSFYDKNHEDVYFITKDQCLCYSELLGQFTSFMSYERIPFMFNLGNSLYSIRDLEFWEHFTGEYNSFYGQYKPYSVEVTINPDFQLDKIFNTVEWRSTMKEANTDLQETFDTIRVYNDYQDTGEVNLKNMTNRPQGGMMNTLRRKFRVWRTPVPRDSSNHRDRIRGPWARLKLVKNPEVDKPNNKEIELYDIMVHFFE